jgi:hypothetical protein
VAYCEDTDLLLGNIPLPAYLSATKYITDAADEIDSKIGFVYTTPVVLSESDLELRPTRLLLKRINAHLATGRLIMAMDAGGEKDRLHAYGYSLVQEAVSALQGIVDGQIILEGAIPIASDAPRVTAVIIKNVDPESQVEAFYDRVANPSYQYFGAGGLGEGFVR